MAGLVQKEVNFKSWKVPELKKYLQVRGLSVSNKKKEELVEQTEKAHELALELTDDSESISDVVNGSWRCFISFRWRCYLFIIYLFIIILPHTMNYKLNKNNNK